MLNYIEKGVGLRDAIANANLSLIKLDGKWVYRVQDESSIQAIIDTFEPLPIAQAEAKELVKQVSATQRLKFVTQAAGKDAEYTYKALEATQFDMDGSIGVFMQGRINATNETATAIAAEWNAKGAGWKQVGASIAGLEDKASMLINAETDWKNCVTIANSIVTQIEAIKVGHFEGKSKQYKEGWIARCEGELLHKCPYADDTAEALEWENGWLDSDDNATSAQPDDA